MKTEKMNLIKSVKDDLNNNPIESYAPTYQPIYFKEFEDIETSLNRSFFYEKFGLISKYIDPDLTNKSVLDVGSNAGFFSFALSEKNATVDALEPKIQYFELCKKLCKIYGISNINFHNTPISIEFLNNKKYDHGFMLSVFQWISEGNSKLHYAKKILFEISKHVDTLFFELGCNRGKSAINTTKINHIAFVYSLLRNNTIYKSIKLIGVAKIWGRRSYRGIFICSHRKLPIKEPIYSFLKWLNI